MKPASVTAFSPGHISGYFKRVHGTSVAETGSIGAGIVISSGVTATVQKADETSIVVNHVTRKGEKETVAQESLVLSSVIGELGITASVVTECSLPIGAGFGLSAAALLATLTALNRLYDVHMTEHQIAQIAHNAEVTHRTGLGDVAACQDGGWVVRRGPGVDAVIERQFDETMPIFALSFGPIHTPTVLGSQEQMDRVSAASPIQSPKTLPELFRISRQFAKDSGLLTPEVGEVLERCAEREVPASMTMLGNGVFACGHEAGALLSQFGRVYECTIAHQGVRILGDLP
jgi:pantoate kinase